MAVQVTRKVFVDRRSGAVGLPAERTVARITARSKAPPRCGAPAGAPEHAIRALTVPPSAVAVRTGSLQRYDAGERAPAHGLGVRPAHASVAAAASTAPAQASNGGRPRAAATGPAPR